MLKDIAEYAGVSKAAVSMYLNGDSRGRIGEAKRRLIDEAVKRFGYRPSHAATALRRGRSDTLGLVLGDITNSFSVYLAQACHYYCEKNGFQLMLGLTSWGVEREFDCLRNLLNHQVDGIVYALTVPTEPKKFKQIKSFGKPMMVLNQQSADFLSCSRSPVAAHKAMIDFFATFPQRDLLAVFSPTYDRASLESAAAAAGFDFSYLEQNADNTQALVEAIISRRPSLLYCSDRKVVKEVLQAIDKQCPDYNPKIVTAYTFPVDYLEDPRVAGLIFFDFYTLIKVAMSRLIAAINGKLPPEEQHGVVESRFFTRAEFDQLRPTLVDTLEKSIGREEGIR